MLLLPNLAIGVNESSLTFPSQGKIGYYLRGVAFYDWLTTYPENRGQAPNSYAIRIAKASPQMVVIFTHMWEELILNLSPEVRDLFHNYSVKIHAYVQTTRGTRPLSEVYAEIERAMDAGVDGVMLDNVPGFLEGDESKIPYYQQCRDKIKSYGEDKVVDMNTGTAYMNEEIMTLADMVGIEHNWQTLVEVSPWVVNYPSIRFGAAHIQVDYEMPLGYPVTLETAVRDTINCWKSDQIAWFYSAKIEGELDPDVPTKWLPDWFEEYTEQITSWSPS